MVTCRSVPCLISSDVLKILINGTGVPVTEYPSVLPVTPLSVASVPELIREAPLVGSSVGSQVSTHASEITMLASENIDGEADSDQVIAIFSVSSTN